MPKVRKGKGVRQGDVLLRPTTKLNGERMEPTKGRHILAYGEQTGHHHSIAASPGIAVFLSRNGMVVSGVGTLAHQEHTAHALDGDYEVIQQRRASFTDHHTLQPSD